MPGDGTQDGRSTIWALEKRVHDVPYTMALHVASEPEASAELALLNGIRLDI
jgi:hypothetical protein